MATITHVTRRRRPPITALRLAAADFATREELHTYIAARLHFPDYYGANLDALNDCLGDICKPTAIFVTRGSDDPEWFEGVCRVMLRAARENEHILFAYEK